MDSSEQNETTMGNKWLMAGDFKDITSNSEKWGGRCRVEWSFNDFKNFISANQLVDLGYEGQPWTWCNNWGNEGEIKQRLDKAMSSAVWIKTFENAKCSHIKAYALDHCALMIDTRPIVERKKKRFFFDKRWLQHEEISEVVKGAWEENVEGSRMYQVQSKVRNCRVALLKWSNSINKNSKDRIDSLKKQLDQTRESSIDNKREKMAGLKSQLTEVKGRRKQNRLQRLQKEDGGWTESEEETRKEIADYYRKLFTKSSTSNAQEILEGIPTSITVKMNMELTKEVTEEEIKNVFFTVDCNKAPGSDGMTLFVSKNFGKLSKETCINQSTFIPGRHIIDNIIISHEYLHFLKNKRHGKDGYMAVQLDMSKAYDRVEWDFLHSIMSKMGFCERWINWIMNCIRTVSFSFNINGDSQDRRISGIKISRQGTTVTHLFFADDSLIFCKASSQEAQELMKILKSYEQASGQMINLDKSSAFFGYVKISALYSQNSGGESKTTRTKSIGWLGRR
nr:uncharacterized protein LOC113714070 [Coffea arabica]